MIIQNNIDEPDQTRLAEGWNEDISPVSPYRNFIDMTPISHGVLQQKRKSYLPDSSTDIVHVDEID